MASCASFLTEGLAACIAVAGIAAAGRIAADTVASAIAVAATVAVAIAVVAIAAVAAIAIAAAVAAAIAAAAAEAEAEALPDLSALADLCLNLAAAPEARGKMALLPEWLAGTWRNSGLGWCQESEKNEGLKHHLTHPRTVTRIEWPAALLVGEGQEGLRRRGQHHPRTIRMLPGACA